MDKSIIPTEMYRVIRKFPKDDILNDIDGTIISECEKVKHVFKSGEHIGLAVGSRGIKNVKQIVKQVIIQLQSYGVQVSIIPAMGSHAGATGEGQREMLASYGITEEEMGVPIVSEMDVLVIGKTPLGIPVHIDKNAYEMDGIVMFNRIKPHTDFHGEIESGLMKQIAVGLGKRHGAETIHRRGTEGLAIHMPDIARFVLKTGKIRCGLAVVENMLEETSILKMLLPKDFEKEEKKLLEISRSKIPTVPFNALDVLLIQEMGKNISGTGIDPNVTGRYFLNRGDTPDNSYGIKRIVCLDLTSESHNNGLGVGFADVISKRLFDKIDLDISYVNLITTGFLERGYLPIIQNSDQKALHTALFSCGRVMTADSARLMIIKNTMQMQEILVSKALLEEVAAIEDMQIVGKEPLIWKNNDLKVSWSV